MGKKLFTDNWLFAEFELDTPYEKCVESDTFKAVDIPHDWMIYHVKDLYKNSIGFYKKTFSLCPVEGHKYFLYFEGVYMDSKIFVNGREAFLWKYGYSSFEVDITPYIKAGENSVYVMCRYESPNSRWYSGAGIYRSVFLIEKDEIFIPGAGVYASAAEAAGGFELFVDMEAESSLPCEASAKVSLFDKNGTEVTSVLQNISLKKGLNKIGFEAFVASPRLWDIEDPYLYTIKAEIICSGKLYDSESFSFGFRTIRFDCNEGFFLNGRNVKINGACMHHDLGALGAAMNRSALKRQFEKLIKMGVNSIRTSHNMPAREVCELADEMGILLNSEAFDMWELPKTTYDYGNYFPEWWEKDVTSWIRRDRNHPSIIIWSIGNEIYDTHAGSGLKWTKLLRDKVRELDYRHNAFIGIGSNYIAWENAQKCSDELELSGYNYGERLYDEHHKKYPHWCIFGSETGSTVQSRGIYHFPYEVRVLTHPDGQCSTLGNCTTNWGSKDVPQVVSDHRDRDFVFGQYIWTGWDYIGEPTPYHSKNSYFGQLDTAGFEKDTYYHYQAEWTDMKRAPMVHLLPYWDFNEGQIIDVIAYSNAPFVELFLNGKSLGKKHIDHKSSTELQGHWKVPYKKGELLVNALDDDGNIIATDIQRSFGDPCKIILKPEKSSVIADGEDLAFVEITAADADGNPVANAKNRVCVEVSGSGRLVGLDNGDSTDYEEYKGSTRRLFSGKLLAIVAPNREPGDIKITVTSKDLETATLTIPAKKSSVPGSAGTLDRCFETPCTEDVPARKIELICKGPKELNKETPSSEVTFKVLPENATFKDVYFKALTKDAVDANFVSVSVFGNTATVNALGDGDFTLTAFCNNDKDHPEIVSTLDFKITGLGLATHDAYKLVPGISYSRAFSPECKLSFLGGVFIPSDLANSTSFVAYDNIDFGEIGADTIHLPIFSFKDELSIEIYEGTMENETLLCKDTYRAKSIYNTYQENIFKLSKPLTGVKTITFSFNSEDRFSLQGFYFDKKNKAYTTIAATSFDEIAGDSYSVGAEEITGIGNNVAISYSGMNFDKGLSRFRIVGRSHNEITSLHILFVEDSVVAREMIDIPYSEEYKEYFFELEDRHTSGKINIVFLPGTNFDLKEFQFIEKQ